MYCTWYRWDKMGPCECDDGSIVMLLSTKVRKVKVQLVFCFFNTDFLDLSLIRIPTVCTVPHIMSSKLKKRIGILLAYLALKSLAQMIKRCLQKKNHANSYILQTAKLAVKNGSEKFALGALQPWQKTHSVLTLYTAMPQKSSKSLSRGRLQYL